MPWRRLAAENQTHKQRPPTTGHLGLQQEGNEREFRGNVLEQLHPLAGHRGFEIGESGDVTAGTREARDKALADGVGYRHEYDWNVAGLPQYGCHHGTGVGHDHVGSQLDQFFGELPHKYRIVGSPAVLNPKVAALQPSKPTKSPL